MYLASLLERLDSSKHTQLLNEKICNSEEQEFELPGIEEENWNQVFEL